MPIVFVRSTTYSTRYSSSMAPFSVVRLPTRRNAVASVCSRRVQLGSRSPAICHVPNWLNGMLRLNARDHPVAIRPEQPVVVVVEEAVALGVPRDDRPSTRPCARRRTARQADGRRPSRRRLGVLSFTNASTSASVGGRPVKHQRHAVDERFLVGFRRELQPFALQPAHDEAIDVGECAAGEGDDRHATAFVAGMNDQCGLYSRALRDPAAKNVDRSRASAFCWRPDGGMRSATFSCVTRFESLRSRLAPRHNRRAGRCARSGLGSRRHAGPGGGWRDAPSRRGRDTGSSSPTGSAGRPSCNQRDPGARTGATACCAVAR